MQVQQLIQASANVITITALTPGDVYKRVTEGYSGDATIQFGVVQSVMNNGTDAAVTALEYSPDYQQGVVAKTAVFTGSKPQAIFPATPAEISVHLADLTKQAERVLKEKEKALAEAIKAHEAVTALATRIAAAELTEPSTHAPAINGELTVTTE